VTACRPVNSVTCRVERILSDTSGAGVLFISVPLCLFELSIKGESVDSSNCVLMPLLYKRTALSVAGVRVIYFARAPNRLQARHEVLSGIRGELPGLARALIALVRLSAFAFLISRIRFTHARYFSSVSGCAFREAANVPKPRTVWFAHSKLILS
jgi:hypothetical protein